MFYSNLCNFGSRLCNVAPLEGDFKVHFGSKLGNVVQLEGNIKCSTVICVILAAD